MESHLGYELRWEANGVVKRYFGHVVHGELLAPVLTTESDERFDTLRFVINDFLDVQGISFEQAEIEDIAALDTGAAATNARIKVAIVTADPQVIDLAQRYMEAAAGAYPTAVFATMEEARAWVAIPISSWGTTRY